LTQTGLRLERMPAQDMLDVLHFYFETDNLGEKEEQEAKLKMRQRIYTQLYDRSYTWGDDTGGREFGTQEVASGDVYAGGGQPKLTHKPYIPPTPVNANAAKPYGNVLDAPLG
jgi:hypothetical protein